MLLAAAFEAYVEDVYDLAVDRIFVAATPEQRKALKKQTSGRLNNADVDKVNFLFFHVGIPWIMGHRKMHWQKFGNDAVQKTLKRLVETRNSNAHGKPKAVRKPTAVAWRGFVARLADRIDEVVADRVEEKTSVRPW